MTDGEAFIQLHELYNEECQTLDKTRKEYVQRRRAILNEWAAEHARFKIGDILQMNSIIIQVEQIIGQSLTIGSGLYVTYYGRRLTTRKQPTKDGSYASVYDDGREIIKLNK